MCIEYDRDKVVYTSGYAVYPIVPDRLCVLCEGKGILKYTFKDGESIVSMCNCVRRQIPVDLPINIGISIDKGNTNEVNHS